MKMDGQPNQRRNITAMMSQKSLFQKSDKFNFERARSYHTIPAPGFSSSNSNTIDVYCRFRPKKVANSKVIELHPSLTKEEKLLTEEHKKLEKLGFFARKKLEISRINSVGFDSMSVTYGFSLMKNLLLNLKMCSVLKRNKTLFSKKLRSQS
jgi:hypothetical protein